jgi:hypothetical protein
VKLAPRASIEVPRNNENDETGAWRATAKPSPARAARSSDTKKYGAAH